ncbi:unnamed protein product [Rotaria sordida]|uniref:Uncharacterized protein n=1 Tax=Rotaria sordida TaxID=392033 RepID=A0A814WN59_9BILA|nr:unnamed protein product [Rotaria sordida]CAF1479418.1 unnamed protein product [Rotaria sordida]
MLPTFLFVFVLLSSSSTLRLDEFFPFGPEVGDSTMRPNDDESEGPLQLTYVFPYFDNNHRQIWIANNGLFSFLSPISQFVPDPFPLANDSRLVAGFWSDIDTRGVLNDTGNKVYYKVYDSTGVSNFTLAVFNKTKNYVRTFFLQQHLFEPTMVITATWYRVGAFSSQTSALNTFQIVLSTDGDRSFVFFLYHDIQWTQPSNDSNRYAQAGFNAGDGIAFEMLPHSRTQEIIRLVNESNVNIPGLFAFRVDTDKINAGGCTPNASMISFRPRISSQLGSTALNIYGPCFKNETKVKCHFDSSLQNIDGIIIDEFRAICLTPFASVHGPVSVEVSIDNGETFISAGTFTFAPLQYGSDEVIIETEDGDNLLSVEQYIKLQWHFSEMVRNTFPNDTKIDIELWKVSLNHQSQLQKDNTPIMLVQNLNLTKSIRIQLPSSIFALSTCFIRVVAHFNAQIYAGLNTGLLIVRSHPSLAPELCQTWAVQQPEPSIWNNDSLLSCPMTRWQAIAAGRCCYQPDRQCYKGSTNQNNCWLHQARPGRDEPSAVECYVSITSNSHGAGAECCYDDNGTIITRGTGAGTDNRYQQTKFPVQHFFHDTVPYLQCCMMSTYTEACNKYMYYRPPRRGSNTMGSNGQMWGDPHFGTLDGTSYIFNGYGEYTYLAINNNTSPSNAFNASDQTYIFMSQIRTIPISFSNVTVTKGFAARSNNVENQSVSITISRREHLVLRRGNEILEFEDNINTLFFPEMTISRLDGNNNSHFSLSWTIGVTIEINVIKMMSPSQQLVLNIAASVAGIFRGKTYGLLGTYDGIENNDLRSKNGCIINSNASLEQIHNDFGVTWSIDPSSSLFYYESHQSAKFFEEKNREFVPSFIDPIKNDNSLIRSN